MSYLINARETFRTESGTGLTRIFGETLRPVEGGVAAVSYEPSQVAVVIGGGSGHFPAFAGLVGTGLAAAAVIGDVFASPSAAQVESVVNELGPERGCLLIYGNYAGDSLNFGIAQESLRGDGFDCRTVVVTDDVASAPSTESHLRRGIAGGLFVIKVAAAAAARGDDLDAVERIAARANNRVLSIGVAFSGVTLPGAAEPLFTIPPGRMAVGMGIHGEPGLFETSLPAARELAEQLVARLLAEGPPAAGARLAVIANGLGAVKQEELLVFVNDVAAVLEEAGAQLVRPAAGEFMTSFEMAGVSLSLAWLDEELDELWRAPASSVGFVRIPERPKSWANHRAVSSRSPQRSPHRFSPATTPEGLRMMSLVTASLDAVAQTMSIREHELGKLDSVAGDGDHGIGMLRGSAAAAVAAREGLSGRQALDLAGRAWADAAGGTSGALWGLILTTLAASLPEDGVTTNDLADAFARAAAAVREAGGAAPGDKTMVDAPVPFADALRPETHGALSEVVATASRAATVAAQGTAALTARAGRARVHGDRGLGSPDPGAISFAYAVTAFAGTLRSTGASS